ncbi:MAG: alpha/beta hydrolase [Acidobacteria bacterium]|nr:MAG: alpha/beta hydrolase [Acidobacteriota bacterium]
MTPTPTTTNAPMGGYAPVNGLQLYYEIHGSGEPLILLHGAIGAIETAGDTLPALAKHYRVIAVDLQAHGRTADIDRPLLLELMADDIATLIDYLGLGSANLMGYSLGGGVALQTAIRHRDRVRSLVLVSVPFRKAGWYPEIQADMEKMGPDAIEPLKQTPIYELYSKIAPRPQDFAVLLGKLGDLLRRDYDTSQQLAGLPPTLLVAGDSDSFSPAHAVEFFVRLGGGQRDGGWDGSSRPASQLAILPGTTHYDIFTSAALVPTVLPFLGSHTHAQSAAQ